MDAERVVVKGRGADEGVLVCLAALALAAMAIVTLRCDDHDLGTAPPPATALRASEAAAPDPPRRM